MADSWRLDPSKCTQCGACERACNHGVLDCSADGTPGLPRQRADRYCNRCGHCVAVCASDAITVSGVRPVEKGTLPTPEMLENLFAFRRSTREFLPDPIPPALLDRLIRAARFAPSGCNNRLLDYQIVSGQAEVVELGRYFDKRARPFARILGDARTQKVLGLVERGFLKNLTNRNMIGGMNSLLDKTEGWRPGDKGDWIALDAPALIIIHGDPASSTPKDDAVIAASFLTLFAETVGLGTCFNGVLTGFLNEYPGALAKVGIASGRKVYSVQSVGYPDLKRVTFKRGLVRE